MEAMHILTTHVFVFKFMLMVKSNVLVKKALQADIKNDYHMEAVRYPNHLSQ